MSETTNPQPSDPPVSGSGSGGGTAPTSTPQSEPPTTGTGSGGSS